MADGGWTDPKVPLSIYAHAMRREPGENAALKALVEGQVLAVNWQSAPTEAVEPAEAVAA